MEHVKQFFADERPEGFNTIGTSEVRSDARGHVTGKTQFYADRSFPGTLHLKMVRSPHHHARIRSIDTSAAEKVPGVVRVLTHKDVPKNIYTILCLIQVEPDDEPVLADGMVRFKGEQVVAIVAESAAAAREAVGKV
jgi:CO/xanthine dehydrogenase Mo-binding subunit